MPAPDTDGGGLEINQAVLKRVVETNTVALDRVYGKLDGLDVRQRESEIELARQGTQIENQDKRIDSLDKKVKLDLGATAIGGTILGIWSAIINR